MLCRGLQGHAGACFGTVLHWGFYYLSREKPKRIVSMNDKLVETIYGSNHHHGV